MIWLYSSVGVHAYIATNDKTGQHATNPNVSSNRYLLQRVQSWTPILTLIKSENDLL